MVILFIALLLCLLIERWGLKDPLKTFLLQVLAIGGVLLFVLHCFGVHLPGCLTRISVP